MEDVNLSIIFYLDADRESILTFLKEVKNQFIQGVCNGINVKIRQSENGCIEVISDNNSSEAQQTIKCIKDRLNGGTANENQTV